MPFACRFIVSITALVTSVMVDMLFVVMADCSTPEDIAALDDQGLDWNKELIEILAMEEDTEARQYDKHLRYTRLHSNFVSRAKTYGKIIITEQSMPPRFATIKPFECGGVAGGTHASRRSHLSSLTSLVCV